MALALALLVVGGTALFNALTSKSGSDPGPSPITTSSPGAKKTKAIKTTKPPADPTAPPLQIEVTGPPTGVFVKVPGTGGTVLQKGTLNTGERRQYDQAPLDVVVDDSTAVEVRIYGALQKDPDGKGRGEFFVPQQ